MKFAKNKQKQITIIAAMIEGKNNMNNSNKDDKDENSHKIANRIYQQTLPHF